LLGTRRVGVGDAVADGGAEVGGTYPSFWPLDTGGGAFRCRALSTRPADIPMMVKKIVAMTTGKNSGRRGGGRSSDRSTRPGCHLGAIPCQAPTGYPQ
jgi:hypothetical protein